MLPKVTTYTDRNPTVSKKNILMQTNKLYVEFALSGQLWILGVVRAQNFLFDLFLWPFLVFFTNPDVPHPGQIKKTPPAWAK